MTVGDGLAAIAFWGFVAAVVLGGMWYRARGRDRQHETVRRMMDSGQQVDRELAERLLAGGADDEDHLARGLQVGGIIVMFASPGIALLAWFLGHVADWALYPVMGAALLAGFVGLGLVAAGRFVRRG